nr:MAG TPA: hypothetical protein [Caudoviricetes sp.]
MLLCEAVSSGKRPHSFSAILSPVLSFVSFPAILAYFLLV